MQSYCAMNQHPTHTNPRRQGLSTLEMVLCLPVLLMVMALMINFGTVASWRIRQLSVARHAAWANRSGRTGDRNPRPDYWPPSGTMGSGGAGELLALDDPRVDHAVVRGPLPYDTIVNEDLLDPTRGPRHGWSDLRRDFPMLARMGEYRMHADEFLLDGKWQHRRMGIWSTWARRIPVLYELAQAEAGVVDAYIQAAVAIAYAPFREDLRPLDRDDEFIAYSNRFADSETFPYHGAPDFHPRLNLPCGSYCRSSCRADHGLVAERVEDLVDRIQGNPEEGQDSLAERMAGSFIRLYEAVIRELENDELENDGGPHQAEIAELQDKIDTLRRFQETL